MVYEILDMNILIFWFYLNVLLKNLDIFVNHFWKFSFTFKNADKFKRRKWIEFLHIFWQISDKYQTPLNPSKIWIDELLWWIFSFWIEKLSWFQVNSSLTFQSQLESWRLGKHSELFCLYSQSGWDSNTAKLSRISTQIHLKSQVAIRRICKYFKWQNFALFCQFLKLWHLMIISNFLMTTIMHMT